MLAGLKTGLLWEGVLISPVFPSLVEWWTTAAGSRTPGVLGWGGWARQLWMWAPSLSSWASTSLGPNPLVHVDEEAVSIAGCCYLSSELTEPGWTHHHHRGQTEPETNRSKGWTELQRSLKPCKLGFPQNTRTWGFRVSFSPLWSSWSSLICKHHFLVRYWNTLALRSIFFFFFLKNQSFPGTVL